MLSLLELLITQYTLPTIFVGGIVFIAIFKEIVKFINWFKKMIIEPIQHRAEEKQQYEERLARTEALTTALLNKNAEQDKDLKAIHDAIKLLIDSDKDSIKAWITECHHRLMEQGWVDDYTLSCIEARYDHYTKENGNSFVQDLMTDIRSLPHFPPKSKQDR